MSWSPTQYLAFEAERTRPVHDLVAAIPTQAAATVADLGCGPGNSLEVLLRRYPAAHAIGVDTSPAMLATAAARLPTARFQQTPIEAWPGDPHQSSRYDVILSNAALQWVPDHDALFPALVRRLAPGGTLAVQMPDNLAEPAQSAMRDVADSGPWQQALAGTDRRRTRIATVGDYDAWLAPHCAHVEIWRTTYFHRLPGIDAVVEWFKGSGLRPYLAPLTEPEQSSFLTVYREKLGAAYKPQPDGTILLPFPRLFIIATA